MNQSKQLKRSASERVMIGDYQLGLKIFMTKDVLKSFEILHTLQPDVFLCVCQGAVSEELYLKITALYLTEVSLLIKTLSTKDDFTTFSFKKHGLVSDLQNEVILVQLVQIYGAVAKVPSELIFHVFMAYYTCQDELQAEKDEFVLSKFKSMYNVLICDGRERDHYLKRFFDMFVLNVLPESGDLFSALAISDSNKIFGGKSITAKLKHIEEMKKKDKWTKQIQRDGPWDLKAKYIDKQTEDSFKKPHEYNLKYMSNRQIKAVQERRDLSSDMTSHTGVLKRLPTLDRIKTRFAYYFPILRHTLKKKSLDIFAVLLFFFISRQVLRRWKVIMRKN